MKKSKKIKILVGALILVAVLAFSFWYGGNAPGSRGWSAGTATAPVTTADKTAVPTQAPATSKPVQTPAAAVTPQTQTEKPAVKAKTCTVSISCATVLDNMDILKPEKSELIPKNGIILGDTAVTINDGDSVFQILQRICRDKGIQMESSITPVYDSAYIEGINNLYEFDAGEKSGWMYSVNGIFPGYGCSKYKVSDGDNIRFVYTCDLGGDVGGGSAAGG